MKPTWRKSRERAGRLLVAFKENWQYWDNTKMVVWLRELRKLPSEDRKKIWIIMSDLIPADSFKYIRAWYRDHIVNNHDEE